MSGVDYLQGFSKIIFKSAVDFLKRKRVLSKEEYESISSRAKAKAFTVAGYTAASVLQEYLDSLMEAVEQGTTMREWKEGMDGWLEQHGYEGMDPSRARVIFETNVETAYNAGHYRSMMQAKQLRPYWMYVTAGDAHVRETHAELHGLVYRYDDPFWNVWYPPNGYRCRCHVRSYSEAQVRARGIEVQTRLPVTADRETGEIKLLRPDKGFSGNPAKEIWKPDVSKLSPKIRKAYRGRKPTQ